MAALRKITPELNEIKERFKNDRQTQGTETMRLMKKHGANPLGGCLPMLVQMPLLFSLFIVFILKLVFVERLLLHPIILIISDKGNGPFLSKNSFSVILF